MSHVIAGAGTRTRLVTRRAALAGLSASVLASTLRPASARTPDATRFSRETVDFAPVAGETIITERFNALVARLSEGGGGTIRMSPGVFVTDRQLKFDSNLRLVGSGQTGESATIIRLSDNAEPFGNRAGILRAKRDGAPKDARFVLNALIEDLVIDGNRENQKQTVYDAEKKYGFYCEARDLTMRRVTIRNCMGYGFDPHGAIDDAPSERLLIEDCHSHGNLKDGFTLDRQVDILFRRNLSENNDRSGVNLVTATLRARIEDCVVRGNGATGITVQNGSGEVTIARTATTGNVLEGIYLRDSHDMLVTENVVEANGHAGIRVRGGTQIAIDANTLSGNLTDPETDQSEIHLDAYRKRGAADVLIIGNRIRASRNGALYADESVRNTTATDNRFATAGDGIVLNGRDARAYSNVEMAF